MVGYGKTASFQQFRKFQNNADKLIDIFSNNKTPNFTASNYSTPEREKIITIRQPTKRSKDYNIDNITKGRLHKLNINTELLKSKNGEDAELAAKEYLIKNYEIVE